jgi:hyperosmotically inducible protein
MKINLLQKNALFLAAVTLLVAPMASAKTEDASGTSPDSTLLQKEVRHELRMLPFYSVFDNLAYRVDDGTVTLIGQTVRPVTKSDAETVVKGIKGVTEVVNEIEVLPVSFFDDQIRRTELRAIYSYPTLQRYALGTQPSIHIIVRNGHVTLDGVVDNETDRNLAFLRANAVPDVFSVTNNLEVASR